MEEIVKNMRGDRAFDKTVGKIVTVGFAVVVLGSALSTPVAAGTEHRSVWAIRWEQAHHAHQAAAVAKAHTPPAHAVAVSGRPAVVHNLPIIAKPVATEHRSIWAVRWEQQHPAEAAAARQARAVHATTAGIWRHRGYSHYAWHRKPSVYVNEALHITHPATVAHTTSHGIRVASAAIPSVHEFGMIPNRSTITMPESPGSSASTLLHTATPKAAVRTVAKPKQVAFADKGIALSPADSTSDVTLDFVGADINDVLKALALQTHTNVVSGNDVKGTITVSLTHVSLEEALDMITRLSSFQYARIGRTYVVGSPASIKSLTTSGTATSAPVTAVLSLLYSDPSQMLTSIKDRYPNVKVTPGTAVGNTGSGGVLIVTGDNSDVSAVKSLVEASETALANGVATSKTEIYHIHYGSPTELISVVTRLIPGLMVTPGPVSGFNLKAPITADATSATSTTANYGAGAPLATSASSGSGSGGAADQAMAVNPRTSSLLLTGSDLDINRAMKLLADIDTRPAQISYEAKITEINLSSEKDLGLNWDFTNAKTTIGELLKPGTKSTDVDQPVPYPGNIVKFGVIGRTPIYDIATVNLNALFKSGDAKLLSDPNISALDGEQAAVFIGDAVRYVSSITQTATGPTVTTDTVNIGIKLFVTGKVSNDGYVTLNIHPEVSAITGYLTVPGGGSLPQVANREATTTVRVKDGDTVAIGGLISQNDLKAIRKVPFFGDLPFFGNLFKNSDTTHNRNEVMIFVKVKVAKDTE